MVVGSPRPSLFDWVGGLDEESIQVMCPNPKPEIGSMFEEFLPSKDDTFRGLGQLMLKGIVA